MSKRAVNSSSTTNTVTNTQTHTPTQATPTNARTYQPLGYISVAVTSFSKMLVELASISFSFQVRSKPIDIIYNPQVFQFLLTRFLLASPVNQSSETVGGGPTSATGMAEGLSRLALLRRYQMIKKQTKVGIGFLIALLFLLTQVLCFCFVP